METLKEWLQPQFIWIVTGLILLILEFASPGIIIIFFGIGAWLVAIICFFVDLSINLQLSIFLISSILFLIVLRGKFKDLFQKRQYFETSEYEVTNEFIGQKAIVIEKISQKAKGRVEFHGSQWDAEADQTISVGTPVKIIDKQNITFIVKPL